MARQQEALGQSEPFLDFQEQLSRVAPVERPVLLIGERGTGKELAASRLHFLSKRWDKPFVTLNCATLSPALIESELFGYERGAFTGAERRKTGRFEIADGGTLFLDEVGSIPLQAQEKILRVVEYGFFERVGSTQAVEVDVRIVGATNADLKKMAEQDTFKSDLLDRLSFEVLFLPPLRYRGGDILLLAEHFATRMSYELGRDEVIRFSREAREVLLEHQWPGNIRELKNVVERAVYRSDSNEISAIIFDPFLSPYAALPNIDLGDQDDREETLQVSTDSQAQFSTQPYRLKEAVEEYEKKLLSQGLKLCFYNQKKTAEHLGLTYDQLRGKLRKHGVSLNVMEETEK